MEENEQIDALIELHQGLARQGPGDSALSQEILRQLPALPKPARIADLGCGSGVATLMLAEWFDSEVVAVDFSEPFLQQLKADAKACGLESKVRIEQADMGALTWPPGQLDLLWSEGAAYVLTFAGALRAWRQLLRDDGIAVISELCWFSEADSEARVFWHNAYPAMGSETENCDSAEAAGFRVIAMLRLPASAWWENYYDPLQARIEQLRTTDNAAMKAVIAETEEEIALFRRHSDSYGYTIFVLQAV